MAGGTGKRMGMDKTRIKIGDKNLLRYQHEQLSRLFSEVIVSIHSKERDSASEYTHVIPDDIPGKGPLMGIYSCLKHSSSEVNFVLAIDIPDLNIPLIQKLIHHSRNYDIVVPSFKKNQYEPLYAVYHQRILPAIEDQLKKNELKIIDLFFRCNTKVLALTDQSWYTNLNTPDDVTEYLSYRGNCNRKNRR